MNYPFNEYGRNMSFEQLLQRLESYSESMNLQPEMTMKAIKKEVKHNWSKKVRETNITKDEYFNDYTNVLNRVSREDGYILDDEIESFKRIIEARNK